MGRRVLSARPLPFLVLGVGVGVVLAAAVVGLGLVPRDGWLVPLVAGAGVALAAVAVLNGRRPDGSSRVDQDVGWLQFRREMIRARRRERALTLVRLVGAADRDADESAIDRVRRELRRDDTVWADATDVYLVLPETDRRSARPAVDRLRDLGIDDVTTATFPDDGLTSGALLSAVGGNAPKVVPVHETANDPADAWSDDADRRSAARA